MAKSTVRQKEFGSDHGLIHQAVITGRRAGADEDFWKALADDEALFRRVVRVVQGDELPAGSVTPEEAAQIMGSNFHSVDQAEVQFGFRLSARQKRVLLNVPISANVLQAAKDTHVLVPGIPLSIMNIHAAASGEFYSRTNPWYGEPVQKFAQAKIKVGWYLIRKEAVPESTSKTWSEQQAMLTGDEFVPEANLAVYAAILHYQQTGERLFNRVWARTNSVTADGRRVDLGGYSSGLDLGYWGDDAYGFIGVASLRKSN